MMRFLSCPSQTLQRSPIHPGPNVCMIPVAANVYDFFSSERVWSQQELVSHVWCDWLSVCSFTLLCGYIRHDRLASKENISTPTSPEPDFTLFSVQISSHQVFQQLLKEMNPWQSSHMISSWEGPDPRRLLGVIAYPAPWLLLGKLRLQKSDQIVEVGRKFLFRMEMKWEWDCVE